VKTNRLAAAIGFSVVWTVLRLLATFYWDPTDWHWSLILPASVVLSSGPISWWLRKRRKASRSH
jgi:predicted lysophospholipase L1 biosynthesis ABC-type transport system permease subunit